ncbi:MAG TPA: DUF3455 domain-containing protein [Verrucomicrobiae bacterium]|jgi:hypothetical protein|nr:DUF3455 domain-containing protein [Verrucomicrobiae bacterium]
MRKSHRHLHPPNWALAALGAVVTCAVLMSGQDNVSPKEVAPDVPDAIALPSALEPVLFVHAKGVQIYTCQVAADGKFSWVLKAPEAELRDRKDKVIGQHTAGPTWKLNDGSEVTGKAVAHVNSLDSDSVPWLLVNVVSNSGKGVLAKVTTIQRVHTRGGQPGGDTCDEAHKGAESKSSYTADYYFFAPAK